MTSQLHTAFAAKLGKRADFKAISDVLHATQTITRLPEVLQITPKIATTNADTSDITVCFVFKNGVVLSWNNDDALHTIQGNVDTFFTSPDPTPVTETIQYHFADGEFDLAEDIFIVPIGDIRALLSISYAISKSLQMEDSEQAVAEVTKHVRDIPAQIAKKAHSNFSARKIKRLIGGIMELQFTISTAGLAEDRPDIFWDEPRLVKYYTKTAVYLELDDRWNVLSEKIEALRGVLEILRDEVNTSQSHRLEWIIILLIVFEILWAFAEKF